MDFDLIQAVMESEQIAVMSVNEWSYNVYDQLAHFTVIHTKKEKNKLYDGLYSVAGGQLHKIHQSLLEKHDAVSLLTSLAEYLEEKDLPEIDKFRRELEADEIEKQLGFSKVKK